MIWGWYSWPIPRWQVNDTRNFDRYRRYPNGKNWMNGFRMFPDFEIVFCFYCRILLVFVSVPTPSRLSCWIQADEIVDDSLLAKEPWQQAASVLSSEWWGLVYIPSFWPTQVHIWCVHIYIYTYTLYGLICLSLLGIYPNDWYLYMDSFHFSSYYTWVWSPKWIDPVLRVSFGRICPSQKGLCNALYT